jgi:hypothetical protein
MTRYAELSRKADALLKASVDCNNSAMFSVWNKKIYDIISIMRGLSVEQAEQPATDRCNHVLSAVGLTILDASMEGGTAHSVYDSSTGLPVTWGELIERMNGR